MVTERNQSYWLAIHTMVVALIMGLGCLHAAAGQIYQWTDEKGEVHFTDTPPPGVNAKPVQIQENVIPESAPPASSTTPPASSTPSPSQANPSGLSPERAAFRQQKIEECERNNGIDCAHQVDVQLRAEGIERAPAAGPALAQRRAKMIADCEANNGIDCPSQVDTELKAESLQQGGEVIHKVAPKSQ